MTSIESLFDEQLLEQEFQRRERRKIDRYYPDEGPLRRELYKKHLSFFKAGVEHRERLFLAANRVGKTDGVGAYELSVHLTGDYPRWWDGRRFKKPVRAWAAGETNTKTRDVVQAKLCGEWGRIGTGMIPGDKVCGQTNKQGIANAIDYLYVQHASGGRSWVQFKSYEQGREAFASNEVEIVWLDEEPPKDIYDESLIRTMTTDGMMLCTFTPLEGMTEVVRSYLHPERSAA